MDKEKVSPESCVKAGKCLMKDLMNKMSGEEYKNLPDEEKDKTDEAEVMGKH